MSTRNGTERTKAIHFVTASVITLCLGFSLYFGSAPLGWNARSRLQSISASGSQVSLLGQVALVGAFFSSFSRALPPVISVQSMTIPDSPHYEPLGRAELVSIWIPRTVPLPSSPEEQISDAVIGDFPPSHTHVVVIGVSAEQSRFSRDDIVAHARRVALERGCDGLLMSDDGFHSRYGLRSAGFLGIKIDPNGSHKSNGEFLPISVLEFSGFLSMFTEYTVKKYTRKEVHTLLTAGSMNYFTAKKERSYLCEISKARHMLSSLLIAEYACHLETTREGGGGACKNVSELQDVLPFNTDETILADSWDNLRVAVEAAGLPPLREDLRGELE